jgi:hypothetical protein
MSRTIHPTFGQMLRSLRLRFGWSHSHQCFIRMAEIEPEARIRVELAPVDGIPTKTAKTEYVIWYQAEKGETKPDEILAMIEPLRSIRGVKQYIKFDVDGNGRLIK